MVGKKIKIVYLISSLKNGGPVNMLYNLAKHIDSSQFEVTVVAMRTCEDKKKKDFSQLNCKVIELSIGKGIQYFSVSKVRQIIEKINPDIIHSHGGTADYINARLPKKYVSFTTVHCVPDDDFVMKKGKVMGGIKAEMFIRNMKKIAHPVACSKTVADKIFSYRGITIDYVRNGIDFDHDIESFLPINRKDLGISDDKLLLVFCGYLSKRKNVGNVLDAFEKISRNDIMLLVLGNGAEYEALKERARVDKRIVMAGYISNSTDYLQCADYFISSSFSEGLPLAVLEGMSCGLPAILSDIDSHNEIYRLSPEAVRLFSNGDLHSLITLLENLSKDNYKSESMAAKILIMKQLNSKVMAGKYAELYIKHVQGNKKA